MNESEFIEYCKKINIEITEEKYKKLLEYFILLKEWNNKFNLTTIIEKNDVFLKHFYDSLCLVKVIDIFKTETLCDIGTGAGFPGLVIKIIFDNIQVDLVESSFKKCTFLKEVINKLQLKNINVINIRGEIHAKNNREKYDVVTCRAVSHLKIISEISIPMLKINGVFVPLKAKIDNELEESKEIINLTGGKISNVINYELPIEKAVRNIIVIYKKSKTNIKYPREYSKIVKKP